MQKPGIVNKIGFWSALATTFFAVVYIIPQLIIGIDMPGNKTTLIFILTPSMFLALSFLIMMVAVHYYVSASNRIWSHIGVLFALAYFILVNVVYFTVLTVTMPHMMAGNAREVAILNYVPKSFLTGIDALGYASMSLSTLFAAPAFGNSPLEKWIKYFFTVNGIIAPVILATQIFPLIAYAAAVWIIAMPTSSLLVTILFRRAGNTTIKHSV